MKIAIEYSIKPWRRCRAAISTSARRESAAKPAHKTTFSLTPMRGARRIEQMPVIQLHLLPGFPQRKRDARRSWPAPIRVRETPDLPQTPPKTRANVAHHSHALRPESLFCCIAPTRPTRNHRPHLQESLIFRLILPLEPVRFGLAVFARKCASVNAM